MTVAVVRLVVVALSALAGARFGAALGLPWPGAALAGAGVAVVLLWAEAAVARLADLRLLVGAAGGFLGLVAGIGTGVMVAALAPGTGLTAVGLPAVLGVYAGAAAALRHAERVPGLSTLRQGWASRGGTVKLLDTSSIIDGRILDVCATGFVDGTLMVPAFVLRELQAIADATDPLRRARGKRGFEVLQRLQELPSVTVDITARDVPGMREVDHKLIELARQLGGKIVTTDGNLGKLAGLSGVPVLNVNELAHAVKPVALPGEAMDVHVVKEGKEAGQGVGYLDDGTMVVVDQGKRLLGQTVGVVVTSVLQTAAGRMIFTRPRDDEPAGERRA